MNAAAILIGFILLSKSASESIKRIITLAGHWGFSEFVVSFLFVGIVATFPELFIGIISALEGSPSFGAGIVIGSNIADLTIIVGIVALAAGGVRVHDSSFRDIKKLLPFIALPFILLLDGELSRIDGFALLASFLVYLFLLLRKKSGGGAACPKHGRVAVRKELMVLIFSVGVLIFSAHIITGSAKWFSSALSLPIFFVGSVVAVGTCLPELTLAFNAARQKHGDLGLGDVFGNVFADCLLTLGLIAVISPIKPQYPLLVIMTAFLMVFSMLTLIIMSHSENRLSKEEGAYLAILYFFFLAVMFGAEELMAA
ncbi:MAG: sodium:calcium antiporter [Candidatus Diapherotrites archaeon]